MRWRNVLLSLSAARSENDPHALRDHLQQECFYFQCKPFFLLARSRLLRNNPQQFFLYIPFRPRLLLNYSLAVVASISNQDEAVS